MTKIILITILFFPVILNAQDKLTSPVSGLDTLKYDQPAMFEPGLQFSGSFTELSLSELNKNLILPAFDFSDVLKNRWQVNYSVSRFSFFPSGYFHFPFPGTGMIFNSATWQASPRLSVGGSSFGLNSPWYAPLPETSGNYNTRGMSVFMEYRIGKNLRIGGGVSFTGKQPYIP